MVSKVLHVWYDTLLVEISTIFTSSQMGGLSLTNPTTQLTSTQSRVSCQGMSPSCWILLPFWVAQPRLMRHRRRCRRTPCSARISRWLGLEDVDGLMAFEGRVRSKGMGWMGVWTWESDRRGGFNLTRPADLESFWGGISYSHYLIGRFKLYSSFANLGNGLSKKDL